MSFAYSDGDAILLVGGVLRAAGQRRRASWPGCRPDLAGWLLRWSLLRFVFLLGVVVRLANLRRQAPFNTSQINKLSKQVCHCIQRTRRGRETFYSEIQLS